MYRMTNDLKSEKQYDQLVESLELSPSTLPADQFRNTGNQRGLNGLSLRMITLSECQKKTNIRTNFVVTMVSYMLSH